MRKFCLLGQHVSACSFYKQSMMAVGYFLDDVDMTYEDHEEHVRGLIMKNDVSFASLKGTTNQTAIRFGMQ